MKNILIVIDMQNGFNRRSYLENTIAQIRELTNSNIFDIIIATKFLNSSNSPYTNILNWNRLMNRPDIDLIDGIKYDLVLEKNVYTCVDGNFIDTLKKLNSGNLPTHIFICGVDTDCCVLKIATDLFEQGIMPLVLLEYCNSNGGEESHIAGKKVLSRLIGKNSLIDEKITSLNQINSIISNRPIPRNLNKAY